MSKRYCFTWNNYVMDDEETLNRFYAGECTYLIYGKEVCPTTGTPHLQGFFCLKKTQRLAALKKKLGNQPSFRIAKGTSAENKIYCSKDGVVTEHGVVPVERQRSDLIALASAVKEGKTLLEVSEISPATYIRNYRGIQHYKQLFCQPYTAPDLRGEWYYGAPGTGKTTKARNENPGAYIKPQNKWFDGYCGEKCIILDDLDTNVLGHYLKIWADRHACSGEIKGGTVQLNHDKIIVTSNYSIDSLWPDSVEMRTAIKRRFKETKFTDPFNYLKNN